MKLIIIEGVDRCGKSTLIKKLCKHYNYDNVTIRHFGKPPKELVPEDVLKFQFGAFINEANVVHEMKRLTFYSNTSYYENRIIWNRSHLGEYVYSQMFRGADPEYVKNKLLEYENFHLNYKDENGFRIYLITLIADSEFILEKEDGNSFSKNLEEKTKEIKLFKEIHNFSQISNKLLVKVDKNGKFKTKKEIFNEVINFIEK